MTLIEEIGAGTARGGAIDEYPVPVTLRKIELRRERLPRCSDWRFQMPTSNAFSRDSGFRSAGRARLGRRGADLSRRRAARSRPHRRGRRATTATTGCRRPFLRSARRPRRPIPPSSAIGSCGACCSPPVVSEALTFSFIDAAAAAHFADARRHRADRAIRCRRSSRCCGRRCCPACSRAVAHNRHRERRDVRLFELGASDDARRRVAPRRRGADRQTAQRALERRRTARSISST